MPFVPSAEGRGKVPAAEDEAGGRGAWRTRRPAWTLHHMPPTLAAYRRPAVPSPAYRRGTKGTLFRPQWCPMSLVSELSAIVGEAFAAEGVDPAYGNVVVSQRPELAQFQANGAMAAAKLSGVAPRDLAARIAARLAAHPSLASAEVAGPGFINLIVTDEILGAVTQRVVEDPRLGIGAAESQTVLVDYAGPNVAKAMHVGHLRATIIGDSLARLFALRGNKVIRDPHFGDWGLQMGLVIAEIERRQPGLPYFDPDQTGPYPADSPVTLEDLQEIYPAAAARAETDPDWAERARQITVDLQQGRPGYVALWRHMKRVSEASQRADFARLGVEFDLWYGESDVADRLEPLVDAPRG